ncbi:MAG: DUF2341 domain-containing protein, partial [Methanophagales archaeon]|nr:DUF2341 domain-containing protein [Methanophagales archaeon]
NTDLGFFAANNWWNYNVSILVDNVRLRKCAGADREPFVDLGLAELASTNITPRFRNLYAVFPNQIYVNVTNNGTADARNFLVFLNASYSDEEGNVKTQSLSKHITLSHKNATTLVFIWKPPQEGNYSLSVRVDTENCVEETNETNNVVEREVYVNPPTKWWGFAFKENVSVKPISGQGKSIKNATATVLLTLDPSIFDYSKMNPDGSDLRIKDENGTDLPLWIENWNTSSESRIWFRTDVPASGKTVYLCYGNCSASSESNASAVSTFFEDWEEGGASLERWGWNFTKDETQKRIEEGFAVYGNHSLYLSSGSSSDHGCYCAGYREVAIHNSNPVFSAWIYPESLHDISSSLEYIIDVNVSGEIYHLRYGVFRYLLPDSSSNLYFPILFSADRQWHHIYRNLRDDLLLKGVNTTGEISVDKIRVRAYCSRADSEADWSAGGYFDGIAILSPGPAIADIGNASISAGFVWAPKGYHAKSYSPLIVRVRNDGTADARNLSILLAIKDENSTQIMQRKSCFVPHKSSRTFTFGWMPVHEGNYTVNVSVEIDGEIEASNKTEMHVYPELEWKYNEPIELRCVGNLSDVAVPIILKRSIFDYTKANPDGSDIRIKDDNGTDLPLWIENWNNSSESLVWTRLHINYSRTVYLWYGCENATTASNASAVASFFEDWNGYEDYGDCTYAWSVKGWRLKPHNANGFVRACNNTLNINVSSGMIDIYRDLHINSDAPVLSARLKVDNGTSKAFVSVEVNIAGKTYNLSYGNVSGEEFDFNIVPADSEWHHIHRNLRDDLEERGVAVHGDIDIEVKQVLLQVEDTGDAYFDDIAILNSNSRLRTGSMQRPDLSIRFVDVPADVRLNRTVPITVEVLNFGQNASEFNVSLYDNGEVVDNLTLEGIKSMENATCMFNWTPLSLGTHKLEAFADSGGAIEEFEEGNNNASVNVEVVAPELFISDVQMLKFANVHYCFANTSNNISIVVNNSGTAPIENESFNVSLAVNGIEKEKKRFNVSIGINESCILSFYWTPVETGNYTLSFNIDSRHEIDEVEESNNTFTLNVSVFEQSDIVIERVKVHKERYAGFMNPVYVHVRNKGGIGVSFNISFNATLVSTGAGSGAGAGAVVESEMIEKRVCDLRANATEEVEFKWVPSQPGNYTLSIAVDARNEIAEQNETNNLWGGMYEVNETDIIPPGPLVVTGDVSYEDGRPCSNASFSINLTLNKTEFSAKKNDSTYLAVFNLTVPTDIRYDRMLNVFAEDYGGVHNNTIINIGDDTVGEGFLNLNVTLPLNLPDIAVTKLRVYPPPPLMLNTTCWVNATIENYGTSTNGSFNVSFKVKDERGHAIENETKRIGPLNYTDKVRVNFTWTPSAPGRFTIVVSADSDGAIKESTERNNVQEEAVKVAASDLAVDIEPPYDIFVNVSNRINVTVRNIGDADISFAWNRFEHEQEQKSINVELLVLKGDIAVFRSYGHLSELNTSESKTVAFNWKPDATGNYTLRAIVDPYDDIVEENESNNEAEMEREVFVPMDVGMLLYSGCGEPYYIKFKVIKNSTLFNATWKGCTLIGKWKEQDILVYTDNDTGNITGVADIDNPRLWFYDDDNGTWKFIGVANASLVLKDGQIFGWAPPGIDLSDPNLLLIPKPDFIPVAMAMPPTLYFGRQIPVKITIENHGLESNETEVALKVRVKGVEGEESWCTEDSGSVFVPAHGNATLTLKWLAREPGWHDILVATDPKNRCNEIDETNNNMTDEREVIKGTVIDVPRDFPTVREAVEDAAPDTVIYVHEGKYSGFRVINKQNISIIGDGWGTDINGSVTIENSSEILINDLTIHVSPGRLNMDRVCRVIHIVNSTNVTIDNCKIYSTGQTMIKLLNSSHCCISDSLIYSTGGDFTLFEPEEGINCLFSMFDRSGPLTNNPALYISKNSNNNTIFENTICRIFEGLRVEGDDNQILHNNLYHTQWWNYPLSAQNSTSKASTASDAGKRNRWDYNYWGRYCVYRAWLNTGPDEVPERVCVEDDICFTSLVWTGGGRESSASGICNYWADTWARCYGKNDIEGDGILDEWYASPDPAYGNPVVDHYPLIEPYGVDMDASVESFTIPNRIYAGWNNTVYVMLKRVTKDIMPRRFNVTLYYASKEDGEWHEIANKSIQMDGFLNEKVLRTYLPFRWTPEETGEYRLKANVTTEITDINETNNELTAKVKVYEPPFELGGVSAEVRPSTDKLSPPFCVMAVYSQGKDPHHAGETRHYNSWSKEWKTTPGWFEERMRDWLRDCFRYGTTISLRNAGEWSAWTLGIIASGENPMDFGGINCEGMIKKYYNGENMGTEEVEDVAWEDALTLLALASTGTGEYEREMVDAVTNDLLKRQNEDSSWNFTYVSNGRASDTAIVIQALIASGNNSDAISKAIKSGLNYLKGVQNADGSFPRFENDSSVIATANVVQAFVAGGREPPAGAVEYLKKKQQQKEYEEFLFPVLYATAYKEELSNGTVPENLRMVFMKYEHGEYELSPNVTVSVSESNTSWTILDKDHSKEYLLRIADDAEFGEYLRVYLLKEDLNAMEQAARITAVYGQPYPVAFQVLRERPQVDLKPVRLDPPARAYVHTNCTVTSIIRNNGGVFNVSLLVDGNPVVTKRTYSVWSKGGTEVSFTWRPEEPGRHNLTVYCDYFNEISESDETNNALTMFVDVKKPDLKPYKIKARTNLVNMTNIVDVYIRGTTDEAFNVAFFEDDKLIDKKRVSGISGEAELNFSWKPREEGLHTLSVKVDCDDEVEESDEGNNFKSVMVWAGLPDLFVSLERVEVPVLYSNATNPIFVDAGGIAPAFNVSLFVNGTLVDTQRLIAESAEEKLNTTLHWKPNRTGRYELRVFVDSGNEVSERDEQNNNVTIQKEVVLPDLIPVAANTPPHLFYNESNRVRVNISGAGDDFNVTLLVSGGHCPDTDENCTLNESESEVIGKKNISFYGNTSVSFTWKPERVGKCNLTVLVDPDDDLYEANETNNNMTRKVRVYERIPVEIIAPGGGETWKGTKEIRWNASFRKPVSIDIWYSPNRGKKWVVIAQNTENDGVFAWDTKTVADGYDYSIKIEAYAEDAYGEAKSNLFTISNRGTEKSWKGFHANAGFALSTTPNAPDLLWTSPNIGAVPSSSLIIANGKIYVLCTDGRKGWVTCLDEDTGNTEWKSNPRGEWGEMSWATPAYYNGKIYVPMRGTITVWVQHQDSMVANPYSVGAVALHEIDAASGDANVYYYPGGTKETVNAVNGGALAAYDTVFFNTYNNRTYYKVGSEHKFTGEDIVSLAKVNKGGNYLFRLQDDTGRPIAVEDWDRGGGYDWAFRVDEAYAMSTPGAGYGNIYVGGGNMGFNSGKLYCVNEATGKRNWKRSYPASVFCSPTVVGGNVYITTYGSSAATSGVYAVDAMNGERVWDHRWKTGERPSDSTPAYAPFDDGYVYVAGGGGRTLKDTFVACLDATNGNLKWDVHTKVDKKGLLHYIGYWTNSPVVSIDRKVFVGEPVGGSMSFEYQGLWCLGALTGKEIWHTEYGGSTVAIANGRVYTSGGGRVFAYGPEHLPDLVVESIETLEDHDHGRKIYAGVPTPINVTIKNIGEGDANGTFSLSLQYGEGEIDDKEVDSLKKDEVKTVEFWWTPPVVSQPRNYTLQAEVNANKGVNEADLTNNRKSTEVTVYPQPPDIELVKIDAPSRAEVGESCSIRVEVRNNGA